VIIPPVTVSANGTVEVPPSPGLGFEVDLDYLSAHTENVERIKIKNFKA
jgi:L-alanine-DL-glutamate epimerase-like enolase superfamily enzyme